MPESAHEALIALIKERVTVGMQTYGRPLTPFNGRDALRDALDEALDLCAYLMQAIQERDYAQEAKKVG